ncbi:MAG: endonuclease [Paramuribaculum sp.]|nr:endonuclease [Paramuribaculum sp.]
MKLFNRLITLAIISLGIQPSASAAIPSGYYDKCEGKTGQALLEALCSTISSHTTVSYSGLWELYKTSDIDENGLIWDMYSTKRWNPGKEQCGNYSSIGDCYNREHSFPKSWFSDASPMVSDAFHIYPTDGKVNGQRGNNPFGECANGSYVASSGGVKALGRLGSSTFSGYTGTVFEPDDMYKGDFARSYFYMAACYNNKIASWSSPMLAGNSYPAFTTWAVNLLLKWTRMDEVSAKELNRQEVVYGKQNNRNPFIDYPELAEYIWGNKVGTPWHATNTVTPELSQPSDLSTINLGYAAAGVKREQKVMVKGSNITEAAYLFTSGSSALSVSPTTLTPAQVNQGYNVTVSLTSATAGDVEGSLNIICGDLTSEVSVICTVEDGLPIYDASNISSESFMVRWVYLNDATEYTLHVKQGAEYIPGYPKTVNASSEHYEVSDLDALTEYSYYLTSGSLTSAVKKVTTSEALPYIGVMFDGTLAFETAPGQPSDVAEILLDIQNIEENVTVEVDAPFQVSTDKYNWDTFISLTPGEERFYLRVLSGAEGTYTTFINVSCDAYTNDQAEAKATVSATAAPASFVEDWEDVDDASTSVKAYSTTEFQGTACRWKVTNGGFGTSNQDKGFNNTTVLRMNKATSSKPAEIAMAEDKTGGIGTVTFDVAKWLNASDASIALTLSYSTDGGTTWQTAETYSISETTAKTYTAEIDVTGSARIRFSAGDGSGRWLIDNISITNYSALAAVEDLYYHSWDAYCLGGQLMVECKDKPEHVAVYSVDGMLHVNTDLEPGLHSFDLAKGLYIVVVDDFARRVVIK